MREPASGHATFLGSVAGDERATGVEQLRLLATTAVIGERTARMKAAARWRPDRVRHLARYRLALAARQLDAGDRIEEQSCIRMPGAANNCSAAAISTKRPRYITPTRSATW